MTRPDIPAAAHLGGHLLGRNRHPGDDRDYPLGVFLAGGSVLDAQLAALQKSHTSGALKAWATTVTAILDGAAPTPTPSPTPTPTPTPSPTPTPTPTGDVTWMDADDPLLDQGQTGHCCGFGAADWCNANPVDDHKLDADGHAFYYACKVVDGEPRQENGSTVHSVATVLVNAGRLKTYAWATSTAEITAFVQNHGPVIVGTDWENDMFNPDANYRIRPTGGVAGGHCYLIAEWHPEVPGIPEPVYGIRNSWGAWGKTDSAFITVADFADLLSRSGAEAMAGVELP